MRLMMMVVMCQRVCGHWPIGGHLLRQQRPHPTDVHLWLCSARLSSGCNCALQGCATRARIGFLLCVPQAFYSIRGAGALVAWLLCLTSTSVLGCCEVLLAQPGTPATGVAAFAS